MSLRSYFLIKFVPLIDEAIVFMRELPSNRSFGYFSVPPENTIKNYYNNYKYLKFFCLFLFRSIKIKYNEKNIYLKI